MTPVYIQRFAILVIGLTFFVDNYAATVIVPLLPALDIIGNELRGAEVLGAYGAAYVVGVAVSPVVHSRLGSLYTMLAACTLLLGMATLLYFQASSFIILIAARLLQGFASALNDVAANTLVPDLFEPEARAAAFGWTAMLCNAGLAFGPFIGGWLFASFENGDWNLVLLSIVGVVVLDAALRVVLAVVMTHHARGQAPFARSLDNVASNHSANGDGLEGLLPSPMSEPHRASPRANDILEPAYLQRHALGEPAPSCFGTCAHIARSKLLLGANFFVLLFWLVFYSLTAALPWHFGTAYGYSAEGIGATISLIYICSVAAAPVTPGVRALREQPMLAICSASLVLTASAVLFLYEGGALVDLVAVGLSGTALGLLVPAAKLIVTHSAEAASGGGPRQSEWQSQLFAAYFTCQGLAMVGGSLVGGSGPFHTESAWRLYCYGLLGAAAFATSGALAMLASSGPRRAGALDEAG